jgi:hypothetical protein
MKTILKVVVAALLLNAVVRLAAVSWDYYQLRDEAQQLVTFGASSTSTDLRQAIVEAAMELDVPLSPENVSVRRIGPRTVAEASYSVVVEFFPNFPYPMNFSFRVDAVTLGGVSPN